jgi:hypothetical protein
METVAALQESAYDQLFQYAQRVAKTLTSESPEISPSLRDALNALKTRSVLLQYQTYFFV